MDTEELLDTFIGPSNTHKHRLIVETEDGDHDITLEHAHHYEAGRFHTHTITFGSAWRETKEII